MATLIPDLIPSSAAPFFQEYDLALIDPQRDAHLVIERILAYGNRQEIAWLYRRYGREKLVDWVAQAGAMRLPRSRYKLWCVLFEIMPVGKPETPWNH